MSRGGPVGELAVRRIEVPQRVRRSHVEWVSERLSERDWAIALAVNRVRLVQGAQLERLFFHELSDRSRVVTRGRVLRRLVTWRVLEVLPRRIGGAPRGSSGAAYAIGSTGQRLLLQRLAAMEASPRVRHAGVPTERTVRHTIAVSELYVSLVERVRKHSVMLASFDAEPACWWPDGLRGYLKPDAYLVLEAGKVREHTWAEVDLATESLPTLKRKMQTYLDFVQRGQLGPRDVVPRILIIVPDQQRYEAVQPLLERLPGPASSLFHVSSVDQAPDYLLQCLRE